ncbi:MAG TPA: nucleotidyltransferase domain-containing protein [Patescibacteria group bacterium]|nr:nucleotidyltransferase domain-containing protein [Patescibacteria group bacterium]
MLLLENRKIKNSINKDFSKNEIMSLIYHSIFNYPLNQNELIKWLAGDKATRVMNKGKIDKLSAKINSKNGYFYLKGQNNFILQRLLKKRIGERKKTIARKAAKILSFIPSIDAIALTGAVSMDNANENSDIDLLIITKKGTLWTTRIISYTLLALSGIKVRKFEKSPVVGEQKDKLCLNMWLDEGSLYWKGKKNLFIAHEIAQVIPLVNKEKTYEKFILKNKWIKDFWPNAVPFKILTSHVSKKDNLASFIIRFSEPLSYRLQKWYMRRKITREVVTVNKAIFHPFNWRSLIQKRLSQLLA